MELSAAGEVGTACGETCHQHLSHILPTAAGPPHGDLGQTATLLCSELPWLLPHTQQEPKSLSWFPGPPTQLLPQGLCSGCAFRPARCWMLAGLTPSSISSLCKSVTVPPPLTTQT